LFDMSLQDQSQASSSVICPMDAPPIHDPVHP
jgi:hypothetical protein